MKLNSFLCITRQSQQLIWEVPPHGNDGEQKGSSHDGDPHLRTCTTMNWGERKGPQRRCVVQNHQFYVWKSLARWSPPVGAHHCSSITSIHPGGQAGDPMAGKKRATWPILLWRIGPGFHCSKLQASISLKKNKCKSLSFAKTERIGLSRQLCKPW
jgi:hypothetical protein